MIQSSVVLVVLGSLVILVGAMSRPYQVRQACFVFGVVFWVVGWSMMAYAIIWQDIASS
jgi:glucan phosphoethanolaminetransferase (alkaline phosphatase superfamily)